MATAFSHGAAHLLLGEHSSVLTGPYYPDHHVLTEQSLSTFVQWYDFAVRYGDLLYDPEQVDVTETFTGGINGDVIVSGAPVSTKAEAWTLWTRVVRTRHGLIVHLINLTDQASVRWDEGKNAFSELVGVEIALSFVARDAAIQFATVEEPDFVDLASSGVSSTDQQDALSAAQSGTVYCLPSFRSWAMIRIPM